MDRTRRNRKKADNTNILSIKVTRKRSKIRLKVQVEALKKIERHKLDKRERRVRRNRNDSGSRSGPTKGYTAMYDDDDTSDLKLIIEKSDCSKCDLIINKNLITDYFTTSHKVS